MRENQREELLDLQEVLSDSAELEVEESEFGEIVDDEPGAHKPHRNIHRYGRSHLRFNRTMKGKR